MRNVGDVEPIRIFDITNESGDVANPGAVKLEVLSPAKTLSIYTFSPESGPITNPKTGEYLFHLALSEAGAWQYKWVCSGGVELVEQGTIHVAAETIPDPFPDDALTVAEVWARSELLKDKYPQGSGDPGAVMLIATAAPLVGSLTGREIAGTEGEAVPDGLLEVALRAVAMKAEQLHSAVGSSEAREDSIDRSRLRSISAGSWAESYWGPDDVVRGKALDSDSLLASLLWAMCTDEKKTEWEELWSGREKGFSVIESFSYSSRPGGY